MGQWSIVIFGDSVISWEDSNFGNHWSILLGNLLHSHTIQPLQEQALPATLRSQKDKELIAY